MTQAFESVEHLLRFTELQQFVFTSKPRRLRMWDILSLSLANGDFNPAHCRPEFAAQSIFGGIVSQGIGTLARAEGQFVQLLPQFIETSVEIIARGYEKVSYFSPLYLGETYQYRFEIVGLQFKKSRYDLACRIVCEVLGPNTRVVAEAFWRPSLIEHKGEEAERFLRPKGYGRNVLEVLVLNPLETLSINAFVVLFVAMMVFSLMICGALSTGVITIPDQYLPLPALTTSSSYLFTGP